HPQHQAQILSQLQAFARCDSTQGWRERVERLQATVAIFETAALKEFRQGYESGDIDGTTRKYAHVLWALNGGNSAVELFIHHNHMVTQRSDLGKVADCIDESTQR
ncbi:F-box protein, partial [Aspergillus sclerotialis]